MSGRDRTGMVALLLLAAVDTAEDAIVADYLCTVRLGELRAANTRRADNEPALDDLCRKYRTTTEGAFRDAVRNLDLPRLLRTGRMCAADRAALVTWRGAVHA